MLAIMPANVTVEYSNVILYEAKCFIALMPVAVLFSFALHTAIERQRERESERERAFKHRN